MSCSRCHGPAAALGGPSTACGTAEAAICAGISRRGLLGTNCGRVSVPNRDSAVALARLGQTPATPCGYAGNLLQSSSSCPAGLVPSRALGERRQANGLRQRPERGQQGRRQFAVDVGWQALITLAVTAFSHRREWRGATDARCSRLRVRERLGRLDRLGWPCAGARGNRAERAAERAADRWNLTG